MALLRERQDYAAILKVYRMSLRSRAVLYDDRDKETACLLRAASVEAARLAAEAELDAKELAEFLIALGIES